MAKPPECAHCKKPATIHLTQIIDNEIKKLDFCEDCPFQKGISESDGFSLAELLAQGPGPFAETSKNRSGRVPTGQCGTCGFTPEDFRKRHRLGCPDCYEDLNHFVGPMIANMQSGTDHHGKVPARHFDAIERDRRIRGLEDALQRAVMEERYEDAAAVRDELAKLRETTPAKPDASTSETGER